jgi:hypothetical protein
MESIREKLRGRTSKLKERQSERLGIKPKTRRFYKKVLLSLEPDDVRFLDHLVNEINAKTKRQTSRSEMVRLAIDLLRIMEFDEIITSLKEL